MKVYKFIPILAVALLMPSFAEADHEERGRNRQYVDDRDRGPLSWATYGRRGGYDRGYGRYDRGRHRGYGHKTTYDRRRHGHYDDHYYCDHHGHDHHHHHRGHHRRGRRGIHFGGVIVIRF